MSFYQDPFQVYQQLRITQGDVERGIRVRDDLQRLVNQMGYYNARLEITGSCASKVGLRGADVDLTLMNSPDLLHSLAMRIKQSPSSTFRLMKEISAGVPILDLRHNVSGSPVDVSWNKLDALIMTRLLKVLAEKYPLLEPMIVCIKYWAKENKLLNSKNNYFSGFIFSLMVIFYLQQKGVIPPIKLPPYNNYSEADIHLANSQQSFTSPLTPQDLKSHLANFFIFFANENLYHQAMNIRSGRMELPRDGLSSAVKILHPVNGIDNCAAFVGDKQLVTAIGLFKEAARMLAGRSISDVILGLPQR